MKGARKCDCDPILQPKALRVVSSFDLIAAQSIMKRITDRILEIGKGGLRPLTWSAMQSHDFFSTYIE